MKEFIHKLEKLNLFLVEKDGELILKGRKGKLSKEEIGLIKKNNFIVSFIKENKSQLIDYIANHASQRPIYKLSPLQEGMLFHGLYDKSSKAYSKQLTVDFPKGLDLQAFNDAWDYILQRHSILRSCFIIDKVRVPLQSVFSKVSLPIEYLDFCRYSKEEQDKQFAILLKEDIEKGFDFKTPPLIRCTLVKKSDIAYSMILTHHHILWDGWSTSIIMKEFKEAYTSYAQGKKPFEQPEDCFEDYIKYINEKDEFEAKQFWENYLNGLTEPSLLPFIDSIGETTKGGGNSRKLSLVFDTVQTERIKTFAQSNHLTVNTLMQGVWAFLLSKYTNSNQVSYGVTVSGRPSDLEYAEQRVGMFINTLPLFTEINHEESITEWLGHLQEEQTNAREYQYCALNTIQNWIGLVGDFFDSILVYENFPVQEFSEDDSLLSVENVKGHQYELTNYPLTIVVVLEEELKIHLNYNDQILELPRIEMIKNHIQGVINQIVEKGECKIADLEILTKEERQYLVTKYNQNQIIFPKDKTIVDLFEEQVQKTPKQTAVVFNNSTLSFQELNAKANQLGNYLQSKGVTRNQLVGICNDNPLEFFVSILGILKSGGAYVPIDSKLPIERINYILEDTAAKFVVCSNELSTVFSKKEGILTVLIDRDWPIIENLSTSAVQNQYDADQLLYVIYTSGSTGNPKGVMLTHNNLMDYLFGLFSKVSFKAGEQFGLMSTMSADLGNTILFSSIAVGGELHLFTKDTLSDGDSMKQYFLQNDIDYIKIVPSHWKAFEAEEELLLPKKMIIFGGEELSIEIVNKIKASNSSLEIINHYGPTETTIGKLLHKIDLNNQYNNKIPIGKPFSNTKIYIVDEHLQLCPIGVMGELLIGGLGGARGYLNKPALDKEKFIKNPFDSKDSSKLYRTGDLVQMQTNGDILFKGRIDDQVKIRGYRVELGEIQTVLEELSLIKQSVVISDIDKEGYKRLVAYIVPKKEYNKQTVQNHLKQRLPEYMVPAILIELVELPLTSNGKVDRKQLPKPEEVGVTNKVVAPRNEIEEKLAAIWKQLLDVGDIGIHDNFFDLGGHSLMAIRVVLLIRKKLKTKVAIKDLFEYPTIATLSAFIQEGKNTPKISGIKPQERPDKIPVSYAQERLWVIDRLQGSTHYHMPNIINFEGDLDLNTLERAFQKIVNRHEVLRTVIKDDNGSAYQEILPKNTWQLQITDAELDEEGRKILVNSTIGKPFVLAEDHMLRAHLIKVTNTKYTLVIVLHHIVSDGWSMPILFNELIEIYKAEKSNKIAQLKQLPIQYADYAIWQRNHLKKEALEKQLTYWEKKLQNTTPLNLPTNFARPNQQSKKGNSLTFAINDEISEGLKKLAKQEGVTLFMLHLAIFKLLLFRYTNQEDITVGSPIANRTQAEVAPLIGFFVNILAIRSELKNDHTFKEFLTQLKSTTLDAYAAQDVPFEKIVDRVAKDRDLSRSPIFQVSFMLRNYTPEASVQLPGVLISTENRVHDSSKFDLTLYVSEQAQGFNLVVEYCTDLFKVERINNMMRHYQMLCKSVISNPQQYLSTLPMLMEDEQQLLLENYSNIEVDYPKNKTIIDLFETQVKNRLEHIAVTHGDKSIDYKTLNERSNQLANYLRRKGVGKETLVGICINRSIDMIVGILGIIKSGAAYVPVDPTYPTKRIKYIFEDDSACKYVITNESSKPALSTLMTSTVVCLNELEEELVKESSSNLSIQIEPSNLLYVIYTSGTTGQPKGVLLEHKNLVRLFRNDQMLFDFNSNDVWTMFHSFCFDFSIWEMYGALLHGGRLVLVSEELQKDSVAYVNLLEKEGVTILNQTPTAFNVIKKQALKQKASLALRMAIFGGEALNLAQLDTWNKAYPNCKLINMYGITETTIHVTYKEILRIDIEKAKSNIGQPIPTLACYILDDNGNLAPIGVSGELYVAGEGVARGYLNRPLLTAERFISNPFDKGKTRLYKTGDIGRWLKNGDLEYIGRKDNQVKIRGYRIELGEIEQAIEKSEMTMQNVVLAKENSSGHKQLIAYITPTQAYNKQKLQTYLQQQLPSFMVPFFFVELETLPQTSNGKVNKKALLDLEAMGISSLTSNYEAPRNQAEIALAEIWKQLLGLEKVGIHDNFFELGGDSIISIQLVSRAHKLDYNIQAKDVFEFPTIAQLAHRAQNNHNTTEAEQGVLKGAAPLLPIQQWFFQKDYPEQSHYNQAQLFDIEKDIKVEHLKNIVEILVQQHDALRFCFSKKEGQWIQEYSNVEGKLEIVTVKGNSERSLSNNITELCNTYQKSLNISKGQLVRFVLMQTPDIASHNRFFIVIHHLSVDGVSWRILLDQFQELLQKLESRKSISITKKTSSYRDWGKALSVYAKSNMIESQYPFWNKIMATSCDLPTDKPLPVDYMPLSTTKETVQVRLNRDYTSLLISEVNQTYQTKINDLLLLALAQTITGWTGKEDVVIGLEGHGREYVRKEIDISQTMGWFTSIYPVLLTTKENTSLSNSILAIKDQLRAVPLNGIGFGLLKYLHHSKQIRESMSKIKLDIVFNYLGQSDNVIASDARFRGASEDKGSSISDCFPLAQKITINSIVRNGVLKVYWSFSTEQYNPETIKHLANSFIHHLSTIIESCKAEGEKEKDIPILGLEGKIKYEELDKIFSIPDSEEGVIEF